MRWHPQQRVNFAVLEKKNKLWIWLAFDRSGQRLIDWECGGRDAATLNRLLERLTTSSAGAQAQRSKTLERHAVLYGRLCALRHPPAGWAALYWQG
jgi:IS1 family transposase